MSAFLRRCATVVPALAVLALTVPAAATTTTPTTVRTFETDPVGSVPPGCATLPGDSAATVTDGTGFHSARSLRVRTAPGEPVTGIGCAQQARHGLTFGAAVFPASLGGGLTVNMTGHLNGFAEVRPVFQLDVDAHGGLTWHDGARAVPLAAAGTVAPGRWHTLLVRISEDDTRAMVYVDGRYTGESGPVGVRAVTDITGYQLRTAAAGDDVYVDDIAYGPPVDGAEPPTTPFTVGAAVTVANSPTPVQMPNTAVLAGPRALLSFPAHTDASDTNGNVFAYSDSLGAQWMIDQAHNPMPKAPSYNMSVLRDGTLLATDYHSYMKPGTGNRQATVDVSTSRDGGRSWSTRTATMTTPVPMRPISTVTDRPGSPLGGFVLVHNVVEDADGTLYQSAYGYYADDAKYRQLLLVSHDRGASWTVRSTIGYAVSTEPGYEGYCEAAVERVADGSLLAVMRTGSYLPMYTARSTDNGATWSAPQQLVAGGAPVLSVYPSLHLMPGGRLVLLVGRPGLKLLSSPDGSGRGWSRPVMVDYADSANGTFLPLGPRELLVFGDRGANWSTPTPATYQVWARRVAVSWLG